MSLYWDDDVDLGSATLEAPEKAPVEEPAYPRHIYILYSSYTIRLWKSDIHTDQDGTRANWESITRQAILAKLPDAQVSYYYLPFLPNMEVRTVPQECLMPMKDGTLVLTDLATMTVAIISGLDLKWPDYVKHHPSGAGKE
jgi:hypothetical protein